MLVITLGDPYSINSELIARLLQDGRRQRAVPVVLVGSLWHWRDQLRRLGRPELPVQLIVAPRQAVAPGLYFADTGTTAGELPAEQLSPKMRGELSTRALEWLRGCEEAPLAVVTGPIDKHDCALAGFRYGGQTEFFGALWGGEAVMILAGPRLRVGLVTNHLALRAVSSSLSVPLVARKLKLFIEALRHQFHFALPHVAVCGVNPHASDQGLFGDEEAAVIAPALELVRRDYAAAGVGVEVSGPLPADTAFYRAYHGQFAGVLAMYHDQGLGPLKTVHFDDAVNVSGGLKHLRTSPDHGPARDRFLQQTASPASFALALELAMNHLRTAGALAAASTNEV